MLTPTTEIDLSVVQTRATLIFNLQECVAVLNQLNMTWEEGMGRGYLGQSA